MPSLLGHYQVVLNFNHAESIGIEPGVIAQADNGQNAGSGERDMRRVRVHTAVSFCRGLDGRGQALW